MVATELLGLAGTGLIILAYLPQVKHIVDEHCSGGMSERTWGTWLVATLMIFAHALTTGDTVFIALQGANLFFVSLILVLIRRYDSKVCHSVEMSDQQVN